MKKLSFVLLFVLMCAGVLAEISISEPLDVYNLGDRLYIDLSGLRGSESGNLDINLVCGNESVNMVRIPARSFSLNEDQVYSTYKILNWEDLGILDLKSVVGTCQTVALLGSDIASSDTFEISDNVVVAVSLDKVAYNPGEKVLVSIEAVKMNEEDLDGFVDGSDAAIFSKAIEGGLVEESFVLPETIEAGNYYLNVSAYDTGVSGVLNKGYGGVSFSVAQIASSIVMSLSGEVAVPGEEFTVGVELFDQSGVEMTGTVLLKILSPSEEGIEASVAAGEFGNVDFDLNSSVGMWRIVVEFNDLVEERTFEMAALQRAEFDLEDAVLSVKNIGNVLYNKTISVNIGEEVLKLKLKIDVGEIRKFDIGAPTGEYEVVIGDGESSLSRQVLLTGNAVSINDLKNVGVFSNYSVIWIFLIIILGGVGAVLFFRHQKTRTLGDQPSGLGNVVGNIEKVKQVIGGKVIKKVPAGIKSQVDHSLNFTNKSPSVQGLDSKNYSHEDKSMVDLTNRTAPIAESALVLKGEKLMSGVVCLAIKNYSDLSEMATENLHKVIDKSKGRGLLDWRGEYVFVVFSPLMTKTYDNEKLAIKTSMAILEGLNEHNKKFKDKIEFGIGVHSGELIASKAGGKLKYTSIGNTISFAKRMSDGDSGKVVVSEVVRKKLLRDLKVVKGKEIGEKLTYVVSEIKNTSGDAAKLKDLLNRAK